MVAMFCSCGDKLYVLNVSVSRFLNGHEAQVTNSGEEIFGAILQIRFIVPNWSIL